MTTNRDGEVFIDVKDQKVKVGSVEKTEHGWHGKCSRCDVAFMDDSKAASVENVEDHFYRKHTTLTA